MEKGVTRSTWENTSHIPNTSSYADTQLIESLQAEYPFLGKTIGKQLKVPIGGVWQPFDSAVFNVSNKQALPHHQPGEHSPPGMLD
jgi:hypothetical protein